MTNDNFGDILIQFEDSSPTLIKKGGQKVVYKIDSPIYGKAVLKVGNCKSNISLERIRREIEVLKSIESEYYPKNYDFRLADNNRFIIVEEYIEGNSLINFLSTFKDSHSILKLIKELCNGLNILWEKRIIHRDVKPDNIIIKKNNEPVIIDLGIARLLDRTSLTYSLLSRGPCTPIYASIEQLTNRKTEIDWRTDQFALGIIMVQLVNKGQHPFSPEFTNRGDDIVANLINGDYELGELNSFNNNFLNLAKRMLGKEPFQRFRTLNTLIENIDNILEDL